MAGRGRLPPPRGLERGPFGPGIRPPMGPGLDALPPPMLVEQKLATQHAEIQRLLTENQRLAATHVALRQELAAAQQEVQRRQQLMGGLQAEKEQQLRGLMEKSAKMEADLRAAEPLKSELQKAQADAQKLLTIRQELSAQIQQLTQELHRARADAQALPAMKAELDGFQQEIQRARTAFEYEKKANTELLEQRGAMEKNLVSMAREVEKLRAELTNAEKKARVGAYGGGYSGQDSGYPPMAGYVDSYGMSKMPVAAENGAPYGSGPTSAWGGYDMPRSGASHPRR